MAGMSRDKCGAAAAAGVMATVNQLAPAGVKVVVAMAMVRNSVGSNCYVADEIITSRAGVRLRVGNTDAEGRMVRRNHLLFFEKCIIQFQAMVDVLCHAKEKALKSPGMFHNQSPCSLIFLTNLRPANHDYRHADWTRRPLYGELLSYHGQWTCQGCWDRSEGSGCRGEDW